MPAMTTARMRMLALGLLLFAFFAGALGGVAADRLLGSRSSDLPEPLRRGGGSGDPRGAGAGGPGGVGGGTVFPAGVPLARELDLTPQQRQQIGEIMAAERTKADSVMRSVRPVLQARYDSTSAAIRSVLTPEQSERFDQLRENRRARLLRRPGGR